MKTKELISKLQRLDEDKDICVGVYNKELDEYNLVVFTDDIDIAHSSQTDSYIIIGGSPFVQDDLKAKKHDKR